jgi:hypothetical protein
LLDADRQGPYPLSGGVEDGVGNGGATPTMATSPMPLTPMGFIGSGSPTKITSMSGTSALTATR